MAKPVEWPRYAIGPVLLLPTVVFWCLWIKAFGEGDSPESRIRIFLSYFPEGTAIRTLAWMLLITSLAALTVSAFFLVRATRGQRVVNISVIILGILMSLLNVFQLL